MTDKLKKPARFRKGFTTFALFLIYFQARIMYLPIFWIGFPNFEHWATIKEGEKYFFVNRDLPILVLVYLHISVILLMSWLLNWSWPASTGVLVAFSGTVYLYNWFVSIIRLKKAKQMRDFDEQVQQNSKFI